VSNPTIITGSRVTLRPVGVADLDVLEAAYADVEAIGGFFPVQLEVLGNLRTRHAESGLIDRDGGTLLVCDRESDRPLAMVLFFPSSPYLDAVELAYRVFESEARGRGVMTEGLILATYVLFAWLGTNRLELRISPGNTASRRVAEKAGFVYEGTAREAWLDRGARHDMQLWSMLRADAPESLDEVRKRIG